MTLTEQIALLRVQLETALPIPLLLVISSTSNRDGKTVVAAEIARSMDAAGYSTLLVLGDEHTRNVVGALQPKSLSNVSEFGVAPFVVRNSDFSFDQIILPGGEIGNTVSRMAVSRFGATCRDAYQVTIVEVDSLLANPFAMLAATAADGVMLTVREGRRVCEADRLVAAALRREQAPFLGVVTVAASVLRDARSSVTQQTVRWSKAPAAVSKLDPNAKEQAS